MICEFIKLKIGKIKKYLKIKEVEEIPSREELKKLPLKGEKSLNDYCKILGIKGYSKLSKEELINRIIDMYIEEVKSR